MSAFLVDSVHIDALLTAGLHIGTPTSPLSWYCPPAMSGSETGLDARQRVLTTDTAGRVGALLLAENIRSLHHRYGTTEWEPSYEYRRIPGTPHPLIVLKAIACLEYQSCEHSGWPDSEAAAFLAALRAAWTFELPGIADAAGWSITRRDIFLPGRPPS
jgi:hypothetical protein